MKKAALWLADFVGEGEVFTKDELRETFPGVSQIDRRVRDLRDHGWIINTRSEDLDLELDEQRLVRIGGNVWVAGYRSPIKVNGPSPKQRQEALTSSNHRCMACGAAAGEPFFDEVLTIAKLTVVGSPGIGWIACCQRCKKGESLPSSKAEFLADYSLLTISEKRVFAEWIHADVRESTPLDRAWDQFRRLTEEERPGALYIVEAEVQGRRGRYSA
ncbi:hypothetical protein [Specibacter sp. NPDC078709]|uniref:hypothetical protein n=1 Tax=Specibacter sp. NPDC078709 TaxID=3154364 RepID=UPI0034463B13